MGFDISELIIPEFDAFIRKPKASECMVVDTKRIIAEILGGEEDARKEILESEFNHKVALAGSNAVVLRYKREKDNKTYPAITLSFDLNTDGNIVIRQIQRAQDKKVSFRFNSSFDSIKYFMKFVEENFTNKGIKVFMPIPEGIEGAGFRSTAISEFDEICIKLENLNKKAREIEKNK